MSEKVGEPVSGPTSAGHPRSFMDEPSKQADPPPEAKTSAGLSCYAIWGLVIIMLYFLSFGPVLKIHAKWPFNAGTREFMYAFYAPVGMVYYWTPLRKPIGMYLHLWDPNVYEKNGEQRSKHP